jgi:hypothetical protein
MYPGELVKLDLQPDSCWLGILISPFRCPDSATTATVRLDQSRVEASPAKRY